jgi:hypothetical protein
MSQNLLSRELHFLEAFQRSLRLTGTAQCAEMGQMNLHKSLPAQTGYSLLLRHPAY